MSSLSRSLSHSITPPTLRAQYLRSHAPSFRMGQPPRRRIHVLGVAISTDSTSEKFIHNSQVHTVRSLFEKKEKFFCCSRSRRFALECRSEACAKSILTSACTASFLSSSRDPSSTETSAGVADDVNRLIGRVKELSLEFAETHKTPVAANSTRLVKKYSVSLRCKDLYIYQGNQVTHTHTHTRKSDHAPACS